MFLYRLEARGDGFADSTVIVIADGEEQAFTQAQALLERNALGLITIAEFAIVEKKRLEPGNGYVVETTRGN